MWMRAEWIEQRAGTDADGGRTRHQHANAEDTPPFTMLHSTLEAKHWNPKCDESQAAEKDVQHDEDLEGSRNQRVHEVVMLRCSHAPVKSLPFTAGVVRVRVRP
jgi:hypothetical protein